MPQPCNQWYMVLRITVKLGTCQLMLAKPKWWFSQGERLGGGQSSIVGKKKIEVDDDYTYHIGVTFNYNVQQI